MSTLKLPLRVTLPQQVSRWTGNLPMQDAAAAHVHGAAICKLKGDGESVAAHRTFMRTGMVLFLKQGPRSTLTCTEGFSAASRSLCRPASTAASCTRPPPAPAAPFEALSTGLGGFSPSCPVAHASRSLSQWVPV